MNPENLFNKDKQSTNLRLQDPLAKKLWLVDAKITQKWALIPFKNACNILRLGQNFARPTLFEVLFYTPASHPFVHLLVVTVVLHALSDKVKEIIEIANYGPAHSPTRACWITFRGLFISCQLPKNISVNACMELNVWLRLSFNFC